MHNLVLLFMVVLLFSACTPRFSRISDTHQLEHSLSVLENYSSKVSQLKAFVSIKGIGFLGHLFHEQADIIVQKPHYLLWAMRSFFDAPQSMVASNGEYITIFDWSTNGSESYQKIALKEKSAIDMFDFPIHPRFFIDIMLARFSLEHAQAITVNKNNGLLEYQARFGRWSINAIFDTDREVILRLSFFNQDQEIKYDVSYGEWAPNNSVLFPMLYVVKAQCKNKTLEFSMRIKTLEINGPLLEGDKFYLSPEQ